MPVNLSIKNAPDDLVAAVRLRAKRNHRSLQGELLAIIEDAVRPPRRRTPDQVLAEVRRLSLDTAAEAAEIVRSDRDRLAPYRNVHRGDRERAIERIVALMREGLPLGGRRFTRDEMHER